jgi:hypothetical protein
MRERRLVLGVLAAMVFALGVGASEARPAESDQVTISMAALTVYEPGWSVLIANFEHAVPEHHHQHRI